MTDAIRKVTWDKKVKPEDVGELARDIGQKFSSLVQSQLLEFEGLYEPPLFVSIDHNPQALQLVRLRNRSSQETAIPFGGTHWVWDGKRAKVNAIDDLAAGSGITYIFTFRVDG